MKQKIILFFLVLFIFYSCDLSTPEIKQLREYYNTDIAFTNVNVIPMTQNIVLANQTLIIRNNRITEIGDSSLITIPQDLKVIDGKNYYLMPGFTDMHTHISNDDDLLLLVCNGVTMIRNSGDISDFNKNLMGYADILKLKNKVKDNEIIGPVIYTAGLVFDGAEPISPYNLTIKTKLQAEKEIISEKEKGYDFIKVYDKLSPDVFDAIVEISKKYNLPVYGHVPLDVGIDKYLSSDVVSIEHLTGYINNDKGDFSIPKDSLDYYANKTKESGKWNCPTLGIWDRIPPLNGFDQILLYPEIKYVPHKTMWLWYMSHPYYFKIEYSGTNYIGHMLEISKTMTKKLYDYDCKLLIGTDLGIIGSVAGFSLHREMELFVDTGISTYKTLEAATKNPAECLGITKDYGTIEVGKIANLVLLKDNPLNNISNTKKIAGVLVNGFYINEQTINKILEFIDLKTK